MAVLNDNVRLALTQALACFDTPSQAGEVVAQEFGIKVDRAQVAKYDPTRPAGRNLSRKLRTIFHSTREQFLQEIAAIPIAHQAVRLRALQREFERAQARGNTVLVAQLLEQAAKEVGGAFTGRRELTGRDGGPITVCNVTPEELQSAIRRVRDEF